jgi:hypothetical protein
MSDTLSLEAAVAASRVHAGKAIGWAARSLRKSAA